MISPKAVNKWFSFEIIFRFGENKPLVLPVRTSIGVKVKTTGDDYFWDGGAWAVAGLSDWSTEAQIRINIPTFPIVTVGNKK